MKTGTHDLLEALRDARRLLALPGNEFMWSSWPDAAAAVAELDGYVAMVEHGRLPDKNGLRVLFLPTGPIQEVSVHSGWGQEFLDVAARFDAAVQRAYA